MGCILGAVIIHSFIRWVSYKCRDYICIHLEQKNDIIQPSEYIAQYDSVYTCRTIHTLQYYFFASTSTVVTELKNVNITIKVSDT